MVHFLHSGENRIVCGQGFDSPFRVGLRNDPTGAYPRRMTLRRVPTRKRRPADDCVMMEDECDRPVRYEATRTGVAAPPQSGLADTFSFLRSERPTAFVSERFRTSRRKTTFDSSGCDSDFRVFLLSPRECRRRARIRLSRLTTPTRSEFALNADVDGNLRIIVAITHACSMSRDERRKGPADSAEPA
jgi:hypothetical protein